MSEFADYTLYSLAYHGNPLSPVFVVHPTEFSVIPTIVVSPARVQTFCKTFSTVGICLMQSGPPQQLLQFALQSSDIILTVANIESLLTGLGAVVQKGLIRISCFARCVRRWFLSLYCSEPYHG